MRPFCIGNWWIMYALLYMEFQVLVLDLVNQEGEETT